MTVVFILVINGQYVATYPRYGLACEKAEVHPGAWDEHLHLFGLEDRYVWTRENERIVIQSCSIEP